MAAVGWSRHAVGNLAILRSLFVWQFLVRCVGAVCEVQEQWFLLVPAAQYRCAHSNVRCDTLTMASLRVVYAQSCRSCTHSNVRNDTWRPFRWSRHSERGVRPVVKAGHDKHDAPRGPKPLPPGTRLGVLLDSGPPCGKTVTVSFVAAGVPLLGAPSFSVRPSMLPPQAESGAEEEARRQEREDEVFVHKLVQQVRLDLFARRKRRKEEEEALASPAGARSPASLGQKEEEDKKETEEEGRRLDSSAAASIMSPRSSPHCNTCDSLRPLFLAEEYTNTDCCPWLLHSLVRCLVA